MKGLKLPKAVENGIRQAELRDLELRNGEVYRSSKKINPLSVIDTDEASDDKPKSKAGASFKVIVVAAVVVAAIAVCILISVYALS